MTPEPGCGATLSDYERRQSQDGAGASPLPRPDVSPSSPDGSECGRGLPMASFIRESIFIGKGTDTRTGTRQSPGPGLRTQPDTPGHPDS